MATLTVNTFDIDGAGIALGAAGGSGDVFTNDGTERTFLIVDNASGSSITVTITAQKSQVTTAEYGQIDVADKTITVPNGSRYYIGPFKTSLYNNSSGQVAVSYSATTSVTVAAVKMLPA
ncbi:MAG: hypothetical protein D6698_16785 [Gammaproteobacteria bacterium]|nr:MAG: hypothetical protein D6698_16785 [Gammaproteobacteria bacterium]